VQSPLGRPDIETTLNQHAIPGSLRWAVEQVAGVLFSTQMLRLGEKARDEKIN
jgi:hypothetical protein